MPIEARTRIGLSSRRDIAVTDHRFNLVAATKFSEQAVEGQVLGSLKRKPVTALEFDADGKVVAVISSHPIRNSCMPGPSGAGNELNQLAVTADQKVSRNPQGL